MSNPGQHAASDSNWRPPDLIANLAHGNAATREEHSQNAGIVYMLAEILTALHRQAEALEAIQGQLMISINLGGFTLRKE